MAIQVELSNSEIDQLASWHRECEKRCAEMREYGLANKHKDRTRLFEGLQKTGAYLNPKQVQVDNDGFVVPSQGA